MVRIGPLRISLAERRKPTQEAVLPGEIGHVGAAIFSQFVDHEYLPELRWPRSLRVYDRMRRSDGQIQALLLALELPIRATRWYVEPASQAPRDVEIAEFVEDNLFSGLVNTWDDTLRLILTMFAYGHSVFELVYTVGNDGYLRWHKWGERPQRTLTQFLPDAEGDLGAITQQTPDRLVTLPADKLVWFTHRQEAGDPRGVSVLRGAYKHWFIKDFIYKIVNIGIEQEYVGIPWAQVPTNLPDDLKATLEEILASLTQGEKAWFYLPEQIGINRYQSQRDQQNILPYIEHHDTMIARSVLAQFITLGQGDVGSYALSEDHSNLFLQTLDATARYIAGVVNRHAIPKLVAANWATDQYPRLVNDRIGNRDLGAYIEAIKSLTAGYRPLILPDEPLEDYLREFLGLPERDPDRAPDGVIVPRPATPVPPTPQATPAEREEGDELEQVARGTTQLAEPLRWRRDLTPWEQRINLTELNDLFLSAEKKLVAEGVPRIAAILDPIWPRVSEILRSGDLAGLTKLTVENGPLAEWLAAFYTEIMSAAATGAAGELGVAVPSVSGAVAARTAGAAEVLAQTATDAVLSKIKVEVMAAMQKGVPLDPAAIAESLLETAREQATRALTGQAGGQVNAAVNTGRDLAGQLAGVARAQYSAILDDRTCDLCEYLDGMIIDTDDPDYEKFQPPLHHYCRCIWALILPEEEPQPEVTWVSPPQHLVDAYAPFI